MKGMEGKGKAGRDASAGGGGRWCRSSVCGSQASSMDGCMDGHGHPWVGRGGSEAKVWLFYFKRGYVM